MSKLPEKEISLIVQNEISTHKRAFNVSIILTILILIACSAILLAGKASAGFGWSNILIGIVGYTIVLGTMWVVISKFGEQPWAKWVMVFAMIALMTICRFLSPSPETMLLLFVPIIFSVFYFHANLALIASVFCLIFDFFCVIILGMEDITVSDTGIRYSAFVFASIAAVGGSKATNNLVNLTEAKQKEAKEMTETIQSEAIEINKQSDLLVETSQTLVANSEREVFAFQQIGQSNTEIAETASDQAQEIEETTQIVSNMLESLNNININVAGIGNKTGAFVTMVQEGRKSIDVQTHSLDNTSEAYDELSISINSLAQQTNEINNIVATISSIADQTNLLALNAAIEAARAGEHGRGFAVVADEVRKLAEESAQATNNIKTIIDEIQNSSKTTLSRLSESNQAFDLQKNAVRENVEIFNEIDDQSSEINQSIKETVRIIDDLASSGHSISASSDRVATGAQQLAASSQETLAITNEQLEIIKESFEHMKSLDLMANEFKNAVVRLTR